MDLPDVAQVPDAIQHTCILLQRVEALLTDLLFAYYQQRIMQDKPTGTSLARFKTPFFESAFT